MDTRYFSVAEANALVPRLESAFARILQLRARLRTASRELSRLGEPTTAESVRREARPGDPTDVLRARGHAAAMMELIDGELAGIRAIGVEVKDPDIGLCDFVARHEGRDVLLCWKLGEKRVEYWHELHTGFPGRRRIEGSLVAGATDKVLH